jgi:hypothetical protein
MGEKLFLKVRLLKKKGAALNADVWPIRGHMNPASRPTWTS